MVIVHLYTFFEEVSVPIICPFFDWIIYLLLVFFLCLFFPQTLDFLFCIGVELISNVVAVSGERQRVSATHIHVPIFPQTPHPSRLTGDTEQSSMC